MRASALPRNPAAAPPTLWRPCGRRFDACALKVSNGCEVDTAEVHTARLAKVDQANNKAGEMVEEAKAEKAAELLDERMSGRSQ
jgi:hypothetical protein